MTKEQPFEGTFKYKGVLVWFAALSFEALFAIVERESLHLWGVGELTVYDTALRIGAYLGVEPREVVRTLTLKIS